MNNPDRASLGTLCSGKGQPISQGEKGEKGAKINGARQRFLQRIIQTRVNKVLRRRISLQLSFG